jgi:hypothetical protein
MNEVKPGQATFMHLEYGSDTTTIDQEIAVLNDMKENVMRGWLEVGRNAENRLVFRVTAEGRAKAERMGEP